MEMSTYLSYIVETVDDQARRSSSLIWMREYQSRDIALIVIDNEFNTIKQQEVASGHIIVEQDSYTDSIYGRSVDVRVVNTYDPDTRITQYHILHLSPIAVNLGNNII
jgi:hypothetical protein